MAVVTKYGLGYKDPASTQLPKPVYAEGRGRCIVTGTIVVANGDNINSKHYLGKLPSHAIILPDSQIIHGAITGLTTYHIGLELNGAVVNASALASALDLSTAGTKTLTALVIATGIGKQLWQIAGQTRDPGVVYDVVGLMNAAASASANLEAFIKYLIK
jgi:hypothetical protein